MLGISCTTPLESNSMRPQNYDSSNFLALTRTTFNNPLTFEIYIVLNVSIEFSRLASFHPTMELHERINNLIIIEYI